MSEGRSRDSLLVNFKRTELSEDELAETRLSNYRILREMSSPEEIKRREEQIDALWFALGWIPMTLKNRKALVVALFFMVMIGGRGFVSNITTWLLEYLP